MRKLPQVPVRTSSAYVATPADGRRCQRGTRAGAAAPVARFAAAVLALGVAASGATAGVAFDGAPFDKRIISQLCAGAQPDCAGPCIWDYADIAVPFAVFANGGSRLVCVRGIITINGIDVYDETFDMDTSIFTGEISAIGPFDIYLTECAEIVAIVYTLVYSQVPNDLDCACPDIDPDPCPGRRTQVAQYLVTLKCVPCDNSRPLKINGAGGVRLPWRPLPEDLELPWSITNVGDAPETFEVSLMSSAPWLVSAWEPQVVTLDPGQTISLITPVIRLPEADPGIDARVAIVATSLKTPDLVVRESVRVRIVEALPPPCEIEGDGQTCVVQCHPDAGSCFEPSPTAACNDPFCCTTVCDFDPYCCMHEWDGVCVAGASFLCVSE